MTDRPAVQNISPNRPGARWQLAAALGLILTAALLAWANTLNAPFIFDDRAAILENPTIRDLRRIGDVLSPPSDGRAVGGRPLVNLSFAVNYSWSGTAPWSYHVFNLAVHALAGLALFGIVRRTLRRDPPGGVIRPFLSPHVRGDALPIALAVALLWTLHPLQTESVTGIVQRTESLCGLFYLLTLYFFVRGADSIRAWPWLVASILCCWLGAGVKEVIVSAPLLVLLYDRTFLTGSFGAAWRKRCAYFVALGGSWLVLLGLVLAAGGTRGRAAGLGLGVSSGDYLLQQSKAIVLYLKLSAWPHPLVLDYGATVTRSITEVWWQGLGVTALLAGTLWALWRQPAAGFLGAWFFAILAPSSSVVPLATQTMAEHRMYLPLAAVIIGIVAGAYSLAGRRVLAVFFLLAFVAGWLTYQRNKIYESELTLWSDTVAHRPANPRAQINLGSVLMELKRFPEAAAAYEQAAQLEPDAPEVHASLCLVYTQLGRMAEAVAQGGIALRLDLENADAHVNLAHALVKDQRSAEAVGHYEAALRLQPAALDLQINLADALLDVGRAEAAVPHYEAAMSLEPRRAEIQSKLAMAFVHHGDLAEARRHCAEALRLDPDHRQALFVWGNLCATAEDFTAAIAAYRRAVALDPGYTAARNNLANALLVTGSIEAAVAEYREALRQRPGDRSIQENLQRALDLQVAMPSQPR